MSHQRRIQPFDDVRFFGFPRLVHMLMLETLMRFAIDRVKLNLLARICTGKILTAMETIQTSR